MIIQATKRNLFNEGKIIYKVILTAQYQPVEGTPFTGYYDTICKYLQTSEDGNDFDKFCDYIKYDCTDFNPNKKIDKSTGRYFDPILQSKQQEALENYINNLRFSFYKNSKELYSKLAFQQRYQEVRMVPGNDGEISESELYEEEHILDVVDIERMRSKLPVLLKSLHDFGKSLGYSAISGIASLQSAGLNKGSYSWRDLGKPGIYTMNKNSGKCGDKLQSQNANVKEFLDWLFGREPHHIAYKDLKEFIYILDTLNIDIRDIDPREYDQDYIDTLVSDYITPNSELVARNIWATYKPNKMLSSSIRNVINNTSLSAYLRADFDIGTQIKKSELTPIAQFLMKCNNSTLTDGELNAEAINAYTVYGLIPKNRANWSDDGYYTSRGGMIQLIDISMISDKHSYKGNRKAILHKSGHLFIYKPNSSFLEYLPPDLAIRYLVNSKKCADGTMSIKIQIGGRKSYDWGTWLIYEGR